MDSISVLAGCDAVVTMTASGGIEARALDLLFSYHRSLVVEDIKPLGTLASWEYFTYRLLTPENCGLDCDTGLIRLTGIADLPGGIDPGDVYFLDGEIVRLRFLAPDQVDYMGQCIPLHWVWSDCNDNSLTSVTGDTVFLASDIETLLPSENCLDPGGTIEKISALEFVDGGVCITLLDDRGDINLNGVGYEIGDAVLFSNYFAYGPAALHNDGPIDYYENRVLASDINDDGTPLTVTDLVYLVKIIAEHRRCAPE